MKKRIPETLLALVLVVGVGLLLYPSVGDWWNGMHQSQAIATYEEAVRGNSAERNQELWDAAVSYNEGLSHGKDRFRLSDEERAEYEGLLDVTGTGIMGYIKIPRIGVSLPIYHGTDDTILQVAIGHIPGSSLPVGGEGTHTVISGHRGLPSARLFTDIDQLEEGDLFTLHVVDQTLTYQVDQIRTVLPDQLEDLAIDDGQDYCTLVTCTPYGVNTHRLLVRGHRVPNESVTDVTADAERIDPLLVATVFSVAVIGVVSVVGLVRNRSLARGTRSAGRADRKGRAES